MRAPAWAVRNEPHVCLYFDACGSNMSLCSCDWLAYPFLLNMYGKHNAKSLQTEYVTTIVGMAQDTLSSQNLDPPNGSFHCNSTQHVLGNALCSTQVSGQARTQTIPFTARMQKVACKGALQAKVSLSCRSRDCAGTTPSDDLSASGVALSQALLEPCARWRLPLKDTPWLAAVGSASQTAKALCAGGQRSSSNSKFAQARGEPDAG